MFQYGFGNQPVLDDIIVAHFLLRVISKNLPICLRICAKVFTHLKMGWS